ncbi:glycoside hydrolase family protein, partial [Rhizobium ruizarguesonis]
MSRKFIELLQAGITPRHDAARGARLVARLAVALVGSFEGLRQNAYPDPATQGKPWTICYGSTNGV